MCFGTNGSTGVVCTFVQTWTEIWPKCDKHLYKRENSGQKDVSTVYTKRIIKNILAALPTSFAAKKGVKYD